MMGRERRGKFVVVDGIDGVGKGVFLDEFVRCAKDEGKRVYDVEKFWKNKNYHPDIKRMGYLYDVIKTSEPTFMGVGKYIRDELTSKKHTRTYSPQVVMEALALDRRMLYEQLVLPALEQGIDVYQSRSFSTSLVYQSQMLLNEKLIDSRRWAMQHILKIPGNAFCYQNPMDFLVVPTIADVTEAVRRAESREKQDNSVFENLEFQLNAKKVYESSDFKRLFKKIDVPITYMDAGRTIEYSKEQAREFYVENLR